MATRIRRNKLPRKSKLRGKLARLKLRQEQMPIASGQFSKYYYRKPGSMQ